MTGREKEIVRHLSEDDLDRLLTETDSEKVSKRLTFIKRLYKGASLEDAADDTLQIVAPDEYEIARVEPAPDSRETGMLTWSGREDFADAHPRVAFAPTTEQTDGNGSDTSLNAPVTEGGSPLEGIEGAAVVGIVVVIVLGLGGAVLYGRSNSSSESPGPVEEGDGRTGTASTTGDAIGSDAQGTQRAVLTDEERVLELLEANGGRMRQAAIAEEFDWSDSKTSRVVGRLADEGSVEKLRLGRENLVAFPDESI